MPEPAAVQESTELKPCPFCGSKPVVQWEPSEELYIYCNDETCLGASFQNADAEAAIAAWNTRTPAASPVAGVSAEKNYHFTDEQVMGALVGTEHLSGNLRRNLSHMTSGEKFSLYRAIVKLAQPSAEGDGCPTCQECDGPMRWQLECLHCGNRGRTFEEWWEPQVAEAEQGPSPEEEGIARAAWAAALLSRPAEGDGWIAVTERLPEVAKADSSCILEDEAPTISEPVIVWNEDDCEQVVAELEIVDGSAAGALWRSRETGREVHGVTFWKPSSPPVAKEGRES